MKATIFAPAFPAIAGCAGEDEEFAVSPCKDLCHTEAIILKGKEEGVAE